MLLERGRNEWCSCGSQKKYKKCCLGKEIAQDDLTDVMFTDEVLPVAFYCDGREELSDEDRVTMYEFFYFAKRPYLRDEAYNNALLDKLLNMKQRYPNHPTIVGHLYQFYVLRDELALAAPYLEEIKTRFPYYVHGMVSAAEEALMQDNPDVDAALAYFKHSHTIKQFDPRRTVFHAGEVAVFHKTLIDCYIVKEDEALVKRHYNNLVIVVSKYADYNGYVQNARARIDQWNDYRVFNVFKAIRQYELEIAEERALKLAEKHDVDGNAADMHVIPGESAAASAELGGQ